MSSLGSKDDNGARDECCISLFEVLVRMIRLSRCGIRSKIFVLRSAIGAETAIGIESVDGKPRPAKDVSSTLRI